MLTNHDYYMLCYKIVLAITNMIAHRNLENAGFTLVSLTNFLFNLVLVKNFIEFLPYYNLKILKIYGFLHLGLFFTNFMFFLHEVVANFNIELPTAAAVFIIYPLIGKYGIDLIQEQLDELIILNPANEKNSLKILKITQLMMRFIQRNKDHIYKLKKETEVDELFMKGKLS